MYLATMCDDFLQLIITRITASPHELLPMTQEEKVTRVKVWGIVKAIVNFRGIFRYGHLWKIRPVCWAVATEQ